MVKWLALAAAVVLCLYACECASVGYCAAKPVANEPDCQTYELLPVWTGGHALGGGSDWPEPQVSSTGLRSERSSAAREMALQRLTALRALMSSRAAGAFAAYIVPTADAHNSEYIAETDARREWLSGFTGSAGTALVTAGAALLWTDGRYYTQFEQEVDLENWTLMRQSLPETPTMEAWLASNLPAGAVVGVDPRTITRNAWTPLQAALRAAGMTLAPAEENLVDSARTQLGDPPPPRPANPIVPLGLNYTGETAGSKVASLRTKMAEKGAAMLVLTALDEVAYTLNLRGSDIPFNPVFFAYLTVRANGSLVLFWGDGTLPAAVVAHAAEQGVGELVARPYADVFAYLESSAVELAAEGDGPRAVWLSHDSSEAIHIAAAGGSSLSTPLTLISQVSPVAVAKAHKNPVELAGMRACHVRDGTALVRFLRWLHEEVAAGRAVTEVQAGDRLEQFRSEEVDFMGPSFDTIAGAGENGAVIHYKASRDGPQRTINASDVFLVDSGGQYRDGTTDITRTRHMSASPTAEQKVTFTRVLKGQILMGNAVFPRAVKGNVLDTLARKALWDVGLDYAHGTGHGVGHFLNVHEGPSGISWRALPDDPGLQPHMIFSNEPGYYEVGHYGIRHEDLVETIELTPESDHPQAAHLLGDFDGRGALGFHTISLAPQQREFIDVALLTDDELAHLNAYHARVLATVGAALQARGLHDDHEWLRRETAPLTRDAAAAGTKKG